MTESLAGGWTLEKLRAKSPEDRFNVWSNARRKATPESLKLARFIEDSGLDYAERGGISMSDPRVVEMWDIIQSPEGREACLHAVGQGLPALAGVEPMIIKRMHSRYGAFSQMTLTAGALVAEVMYSLGYEVAGRAAMPAGSVAQTAAKWKLRSDQHA